MSLGLISRWLRRARQWVPSVALLSISLLVALFSGCGSGGSGGRSTQPPSGLSYPLTSIQAVVGTAIAQDTPTVSGTVTAYTISPPLPAGLTLSSTTGTISGMPTAVSPQATYAVTASNAGGATTAVLTISVAPAPPSNLAYPQTTITSTVGTAIAPDTPAVAGSAATFSILPTLPAGLTLDTTTGTISGTPTAASAQATYTVTATNSAGSTTATVSITVLAAPSQLSYARGSIVGLVGFAISADVPSVSVTGTADSYSVNPALPAGLTLDPATGTIGGTPTAASPKATYTVTASDSVGSTTAQVSITVSAAPTVLLDLGHQTPVTAAQIGSGQLVSVDQSGLWILWDYTTAKILASGSGAQGLIGNPANPNHLVGQYFAIFTGTQIQLYSSTDGHSLATISFTPPSGQGWAQVASDGSYLCTATASGLTVWSPQGQSEFTVAGNFLGALVYAAPGQVQVAGGPAGANVIQTISVPSGTSSTGPQFSGSFNAWFLDGQSFFTVLSNNVWIYSTTGPQEAYLTGLPLSQGTLMGNGSLFWLWGQSIGTSVYSVPSGNLIQQYPTTGSNLWSWSSGTTIAIDVASVGSPQLQIVDLSGATPSAAMQSLDLGFSPYQLQTSLPVFAWQDSQAWIFAGPVVFDGPSLATTTPRFFGSGTVSAIAGASNVVAVSTTTGTHLLAPTTGADIADTPGYAPYPPSSMELSTDGSVLAANDTYQNGNQGIPTLAVLSVPSLSTIGSFTFPQSLLHPFLISYSLSGAGTTLGQVVAEGEDLINGGPFTRQVTGVSGTPTIWSDSTDGPLVLSPDGTLFASTNEPTPTDGNGVTSIYQTGGASSATQVATVPGYAEGWLDNSRLLVSNFSNGATPAYTTSTIYSSTGQALLTFPPGTLPQIVNPQFTSANSVYDSNSNAVYSLADGSVVWQGPAVSYGALADPYIVFVYGNQILQAPY